MSGGERTVATLIVLVACAIPNQGLLRQLSPMPAAPFEMMRENASFRAAFVQMHLPNALFPVQSIEAGDRDLVTVDFYGRLRDGESLPWRAWLSPLCSWGVAVLGGGAMLIGTAYVMRRQWTRNERLPFPLATLFEDLLAEPEPGRRLPPLLRLPMFWVPALLVLGVQSIVVGQPYLQDKLPKLAMYYDFRRMMTEVPLRDLPDYVKTAQIYFTLLGIAYFIPTRAAFSVWSLTLMVALTRMSWAAGGPGISDAAIPDQHFGSAVALTIALLWLGRSRYGRIARLALLPGARRREADADIETAEIAGLRVALLGAAVLSGWLLVYIGVTWWVVAAIVASTWLCHVVTARVVAEVGVPFIRSTANSLQIVQLMPATSITTRDAFFAGVGNMLGSISSRESVLVYTQHADVVAMRRLDDAGRRAWPALMMSTLLIVTLASAAAGLVIYYSYSNTLEAGSTSIENVFGLRNWPQGNMRDPVLAVKNGAWPAVAHNQLAHGSIGFGITLCLALAAARFAGWPFVPVGYLLATTWYGQVAWYSLLLGWLAKTLVLRFGGATLFTKLRPLFIGLIVGEAMTVAGWMVSSGVRALMGLDYYAVRLLPQ